jgi:conjugal transfer pilus assembly protein TraU
MSLRISSLIPSLFVLSILLVAPAASEEGKFINPITDICWKCIFPIHLGGVNTTPDYKDHSENKQAICHCAGTPPKVGVPLAYWEPVALIDVTRVPYKSVALGGHTLSSSTTRNRGSVSHVGDSNLHSFYNVHYYKFPIIGFLGLLPGFSCTDKGTEIDIAYISEADVTWSDDNWSHVVNPEAYLFSNPLAQTACAPDCLAASADRPVDKLFWCGGCSGSIYPYSGHVSHHIGGAQASHLLVHRLLSKLHSNGAILSASDDFCDKKRYYRIKKSLYKTQLTHPIANTEGPCNRLGKSDVLWGSGKSYPYEGEDFVYLIWTKKHCCLDAVKVASSAAGAPS